MKKQLRDLLRDLHRYKCSKFQLITEFILRFHSKSHSTSNITTCVRKWSILYSVFRHQTEMGVTFDQSIWGGFHSATKVEQNNMGIYTKKVYNTPFKITKRNLDKVLEIGSPKQDCRTIKHHRPERRKDMRIPLNRTGVDDYQIYSDVMWFLYIWNILKLNRLLYLLFPKFTFI